jgi:hypothetical protein
MSAETYTANNRNEQTWLVCPGKPDILLTDHLPDGTKVRGDEITEPNWQVKMWDEWYYESDGFYRQNSVEMGRETRQVTTLKKNDWIKINEDELPSQQLICEWLHKELGIINGSLIRSDSNLPLSKQAWWVLPSDGCSAELWIGDFTHWRKIKK